MTSTAYLPSEWEDDDRMAVLFKPLPPPTQAVAYAARLNFWTAALHSWAAATDSLTFTLQDAQQAFLRKCQTPQCLSEVIVSLLNKGSLCTAASLAESPDKRESWGSWGVRLLTGPPRWAWGKVRGVQQDLSPHEQLVDLTLLKSRSRQIYDDYWKMNSSSQLLPRAKSLSSLCSDMRASFTSVSSLELAVRWLALQGLAAVAEADGVLYVKFAAPGQTFPSGYVFPLSDTVEVRLEETCRILEARIEQLTELSALLRQQAKRAIHSGNRTQAKSLLRRRQRVEASLSTHLGALENASSCCEQLRDSRINREVVAAFRNSALALKELLSGDTSADAAAETMDQLQEVLDECKDVSESVSGPVGDQADPGELEAELDALMAEKELDTDDDEVIQALYDLSIPGQTPSSDTLKEDKLDKSLVLS